MISLLNRRHTYNPEVLGPVEDRCPNFRAAHRWLLELATVWNSVDILVLEFRYLVTEAMNSLRPISLRGLRNSKDMIQMFSRDFAKCVGNYV